MQVWRSAARAQNLRALREEALGPLRDGAGIETVVARLGAEHTRLGQELAAAHSWLLSEPSDSVRMAVEAWLLRLRLGDKALGVHQRAVTL